MIDTIKGNKWLQRLRSKLVSFRIRYMQHTLAPRKRVYQYVDYLLKSAVSLLGMVLSLFIYYLWVTGHVPEPQEGTLVKFFVAVGGMIGTMIVFVFSLSMIPVQRAADRFSPFVSKLYREDRTPTIIFLLMATFCLLSFSLALEGLLPLSGATLVAIEIVVIAVTLDLIRWHQRRVSYLLEPETAINLLVGRTLMDIDKIVTESSRWATLDEIVPGQKASPDFATAVFHQFVPVKSRTDNLSWIAHKAVYNAENHTSALAINAMVQIVSHYLTSLQQNEVIRSAIPFLDVTRVRDLLSPFYENLKDINNNAVIRNNEKICIQVIRALETIASHAAMFDAQVFGKYNTTNATIPVGYLQACSDNAQRNNMDDVVLEASHALKKFAWSCAQHPKRLDIYAVVLEYWYNMALEFSRVGKRPLVNVIITDMMALADFLIVRRNSLAKEVFDFILEKIEALVVLDLMSDRNSNQSSPFVPYDLMNRLSLLGLINEAVSTANSNGENESEEGPTRICGELGRYLKSVERHLRNLADKTHIAASPTFLYVAQLIDETLEMILRVTGMNECSERDKKDLLDRASWLLSVIWAAFSTAAKMGRTHHWNAVRACNLLAYFGMVIYQAGFRKFAVSAAKHIASVTASYTQATGSPATLDIADLLVCGYQIELAVTKMGGAAAGKEIAQVVSCPNFLSDAIRIQLLDDLELRKNQLIEELGQPNRHDPFKSTRFLRGILSEGVSD